MFTSFIKVTVNGQQMLINIMAIKYVSGNFICTHTSDGEDQGFECEESFDEINNLIADEVS